MTFTDTSRRQGCFLVAYPTADIGHSEFLGLVSDGYFSHLAESYYEPRGLAILWEKFGAIRGRLWLARCLAVLADEELAIQLRIRGLREAATRGPVPGLLCKN